MNYWTTTSASFFKTVLLFCSLFEAVDEFIICFFPSSNKVLFDLHLVSIFVEVALFGIFREDGLVALSRVV